MAHPNIPPAGPSCSVRSPRKPGCWRPSHSSTSRA